MIRYRPPQTIYLRKLEKDIIVISNTTAIFSETGYKSQYLKFKDWEYNFKTLWQKKTIKSYKEE